MEKFISIPVTDEQSQLVSVTDIALVAQGSATTVVITYKSGLETTITHASAGAGNEEQRDAIQLAIASALQKPWTVPVYNADVPFAVSAIASGLPA